MIICKNCKHYKNDGIWYCYHPDCFISTLSQRDGKPIKVRKKDNYGHFYSYLTITFNAYGNCGKYEKRTTLLDRIKMIFNKESK